MIEVDEAILRDQETTSVRSDRIRLFYPRGQTQTVLAWLSDQNPPVRSIANVSEDNGFTQCVRVGNDYVFPTDRPNTPAGKVLGAGV